MYPNFLPGPFNRAIWKGSTWSMHWISEAYIFIASHANPIMEVHMIIDIGIPQIIQKYTQQTGIVQHVNDVWDGKQLVFRDLHPIVECLSQLSTDHFTRELQDVSEGLQQHLSVENCDIIIIVITITITKIIILQPFLSLSILHIHTSEWHNDIQREGEKETKFSHQ